MVVPRVPQWDCLVVRKSKSIPCFHLHPRSPIYLSVYPLVFINILLSISISLYLYPCLSSHSLHPILVLVRQEAKHPSTSEILGTETLIGIPFTLLPAVADSTSLFAFVSSLLVQSDSFLISSHGTKIQHKKTTINNRLSTIDYRQQQNPSLLLNTRGTSFLVQCKEEARILLDVDEKSNSLHIWKGCEEEYSALRTRAVHLTYPDAKLTHL